MALLEQEEIDRALEGLAEGWIQEGGSIVRAFDCGDFVGSVRFVESLVAPAEEMGHHPDVAISWSTVTVTVSTHSEGGLTAADFDLAARIDALG